MRPTSAAEYAALAGDVYRHGPTKVYSWTRQNFLGDPNNGFFAAAYQTGERKLIVSFRGTEGEGDWPTNISNYLGLARGDWNSQLNTALAYFKAVKNIFPHSGCAVCGHSLGGFLATMVALETGTPGVAFNPAPLGLSGASAKLSEAFGLSASPRIVNFRIKGDVVSGLRAYNIGRVIELQISRMEIGARAIEGERAQAAQDMALMHSMNLLEEAILLNKKSDLPPEAW